MQSGSFWAFREAAEVPDYDPDIPVVKALWNKRPVARVPHQCTACGGEISPGTQYENHGYLIDGEFEQTKQHMRSPTPGVSGCPKYAAKDIADLEAQFEEDRRAFATAQQEKEA